MSGALAAAAVVGVIKVTLSGESGITDVQLTPGPATVGVRINNDGTIDKLEAAAYTQIDAATDWLRPNAASKTPYTVRCTDNNANLEVGSSATGSWLPLTSTYTWFVTQSGAGSKNLDITLEISDDGGSTTASSAGYTGTAQVTS